MIKERPLSERPANFREIDITRTVNERLDQIIQQHPIYRKYTHETTHLRSIYEDESIQDELLRLKPDGTYTRRQFLIKSAINGARKAVIGTLVVGVLGGAGYGYFDLGRKYYDEYLSPESQKKAAAEALEKRKQFEDTHTLNSKASVKSSTGWSIRYPKINKSEFFASAGKEIPLQSNQIIAIEESKNLQGTGIAVLAEYQRVDGHKVAELNIALDGEYGAEGTHYLPVLLSTKGATNFDPRIIEFDHTSANKSQVQYRSFRIIPGEHIKFAMQPVIPLHR